MYHNCVCQTYKWKSKIFNNLLSIFLTSYVLILDWLFSNARRDPQSEHLSVWIVEQPPPAVGDPLHRPPPPSTEGHVPVVTLHRRASHRRCTSQRRRLSWWRKRASVLQRQQQPKRLLDVRPRMLELSDGSSGHAAVDAKLLPGKSEFSGGFGEQDIDGTQQSSSLQHWQSWSGNSLSQILVELSHFAQSYFCCIPSFVSY